MTCPTCNGAKTLRGYGCPGFKLIEFPCYDCKGTGEIDDLKKLWMEKGKTLQRFREARRFTTRKAAEWAGVPMVEWSDAEHGRVDPRPLSASVQKKALAAYGPVPERPR